MLFSEVFVRVPVWASKSTTMGKFFTIIGSVVFGNRNSGAGIDFVKKLQKNKKCWPKIFHSVLRKKRHLSFSFVMMTVVGAFYKLFNKLDISVKFCVITPICNFALKNFWVILCYKHCLPASKQNAHRIAQESGNVFKKCVLHFLHPYLGLDSPFSQ